MAMFGKRDVGHKAGDRSLSSRSIAAETEAANALAIIDSDSDVTASLITSTSTLAGKDIPAVDLIGEFGVGRT